jgi:hypothetical protein
MIPAPVGNRFGDTSPLSRYGTLKMDEGRDASDHMGVLVAEIHIDQNTVSTTTSNANARW